MSTAIARAVLITYEQVRAERCRRSFAEFVREFWDLAEPAFPVVWGKHLDAVCAGLQAVTEGRIRKLLICIPPGHAKSTILSVLWPSWQWARRAQWRGLIASYDQDLVLRDSMRTRDIVTSAKFQTYYPAVVLRDDQNAKNHFRNTASGLRQCLTVAAKKSTGLRGDDVVVDDAMSAKDTYSEVKRAEVLYWWTRVMPSRLNDKRKGARVVCGQRLHEDDLPGYLMREDKDWRALVLASEYDPAEHCILRDDKGRVVWEDWRTETGELLFPEMFPAEVIADAKREMQDDFHGQYNQRPTSETGQIFNPAWWNWWHPKTPNPHQRPRNCRPNRSRVVSPDSMELITISLDTAQKDPKSSRQKNAIKKVDWNVFTVLGCKGADRFVLEVRRVQCDFPTLLDECKAILARWPRCTRFMVEDKANGPAVYQTFASTIRGITQETPVDDKVARARAISPQVRSGQVYLHDGAEWVPDFIAEHTGFPRTKHDDQVDSLSQGLSGLALSPEALRTWMMLQGGKADEDTPVKSTYEEGEELEEGDASAEELREAGF